MSPLWKYRSGRFAGWHSDDALYNADGLHVGYLAGHIAYDLAGRALGELIEADWIGRRSQANYSPGESQPRREGVAHARLADRPGHDDPEHGDADRDDSAWSDPEF